MSMECFLANSKKVHLVPKFSPSQVTCPKKENAMNPKVPSNYGLIKLFDTQLLSSKIPPITDYCNLFSMCVWRDPISDGETNGHWWKACLN